MASDRRNIDLDVYGPLIFWTLLFICGSAIKYFAYDEANLLLQIPMELTLWSTGIFFTLATTDENAQLKKTYQKKADSPGYVIDYEVIVSEKNNSNYRLVYLSLIGLVSWILCIVLYYEILPETKMKDNGLSNQYYVFLGVSYIICLSVTYIAIINAQRAKKINN